ncbi:hypothetical protein ABBQ32_009918 [Trebouxia sp. C0010 RCD-2024]
MLASIQSRFAEAISGLDVDNFAGSSDPADFKRIISHVIWAAIGAPIKSQLDALHRGLLQVMDLEPVFTRMWQAGGAEAISRAFCGQTQYSPEQIRRLLQTACKSWLALQPPSKSHLL